MSEARRVRAITALQRDISRCRVCIEAPVGRPLPHEPRPVVRLSATARIAICGQAPGTRVHASGTPFTDPSGDRLRAWMDVTPHTFYDTRRIAIVPMGFCFPGLDAHGGDRPPRRECAATWHRRVFDAMPQLDLVLLVGFHAMRWHLGPDCPKTLTAAVGAWREICSRDYGRMVFPLPHPSWRNSGWLKANPWFSDDLLPVLRDEVRRRLQ
jgi:uracil-DNA glycosylase